MFLNEAYYGKPKEFEEVDKLLASMITKFGKRDNMNKYPELEKICKIYEKFFNFEECVIRIAPSNIYGNAYTVPFMLDGDYNAADFKLETINGNGGVKFANKKGKRILIILYSELFITMSPTEINSIILHEIGHNFFLTPTTAYYMKSKITMSYFRYLMDVLLNYPLADALKFILTNLKDVIEMINDPRKPYYEIAKKVDSAHQYRLAKQQEESVNKKTFIRSFFSLLGTCIKIVSIPLVLANNILVFLFFHLINKMMKSSYTHSVKIDESYVNEKFADNFAMSFGYAVEVANIFANTNSKFINKRKKLSIEKIPILNIPYLLCAELEAGISYLMDEHPHSYIRVDNAKTKLEYELKNNELLPESVKADLRRQIEEIDKIKKDIPKANLVCHSIIRDALNFKDVSMHERTTEEDVYDFDKKLLANLIVNKGKGTGKPLTANEALTLEAMINMYSDEDNSSAS